MAEPIVIPIIGRDQASASLKAVRGQVVGLGSDADKTEGLLSKLAGGLGKLGGFVLKAGLAAATAAFVGFGAALASGVQDAREAAQVMAQTEAVIESTGGAAGVTADEVAQMAAQLSAAEGKSLFGDSDIQKGQNLLLTFTNINETLPETTQIMVDMAQAMGTDVSSGAIQLGKALNDPINGVSALSRVGVTFTDQQKEQIKTLQASGDMAGAQRVILAELNKEFGGSAEAAAKADGGWAMLNDRWGEAKETLGAAVLPLLNTLVGTLNDSVMPVIETAAARFGDLVAAFQVGAEGGDILGGIVNALYSLGDVSPIFDQLGDLLISLGDSRPTLQGLLDTLAQLSPGFALIYGVAQQVLPQLLALVMQVVGTITTFWQQHGETMIAQALTTWQSIQTTITSIIGPLSQLIMAILAQVSAFWQANGDEILAFVASMWAQINEIVQIAMQLIQATIVPILTFLAKFISDHGAEIQLVFTIVWRTIQGIITAALAIIRGILSAALAAVKGDWQGAWDAIKTMAMTVWNSLKSIFTMNLAFVTAIWMSAWEKIKSFFQGIMDGITGWVIQTFEAIKNAIVSSAGKLRSAAGGVADAIVSGIANGIADGASAIVNAAKDAAMSALNAAKAALGISSPSSVFREAIGQNIGAGLALGIADTMPQVARASAGLASASVTGAAVTNNYVLNYSGVSSDQGDVRQALRAQALLTGATAL